MKINPMSVNPYFKMASSNNKTAQASTGKTDGVNAKVDTITISGQQESHVNPLSSLTRAVTSEVVQNDSPARINELRQAIADGSYEIDSAKVAESIFKHIML